MKNWIRDILLVGAGFAAGAYFMHVRMRGEYQKFADAQIEDVREHYKKKEQHIDEQIKAEAQKQAVDLISGPYRQESDREKEFKSTNKARSCREICGSFLFAEVLVWHTDIVSGKSSSIRGKKYLHTLCPMSLRKRKKQQLGCLRMNGAAGLNRFIFTKK